jgi:glycerol uptake facilitator-like aquaporin
MSIRETHAAVAVDAEQTAQRARAHVEPVSLSRCLTAEVLGTAFLLCAVVGSGIMGERLAAGSAGLALLANTLATGAALVVLITVFGPVSGAHFNPVVTLSAAALRGLSWLRVPAYLAAQIAGALLGVIAAHVMFDEPILQASRHARAGIGQLTGELIATFGLVLFIWASVRRRPNAVAWVVGGYITAAYWFTSSTSFANPAVTLARALTDTFTGIRPSDVPAFVLAELAGGAVATALASWLFPEQISR